MGRFEKVKSWKAGQIKQSIEEISQAENVDRIKLIISIRNIISGREVTPPLYESLEILGKTETVKRLKEYGK